MSIDLLLLVVIAANVLGGAMALPQAAKLLRSRRVDGVSPAWAGISAAVNGWWVAYGFGVGDLGIVPVSGVSVMAYASIAICLVRFSTRPPVRTGAIALGSGLAVATVPLIALAIDGWAAAGVLLGALYGVQLSPAVVAVYRAADVSGVAAATWALAFLEAVLWGVYGLVRLDAGLVTLAATGSLMSALVLARLFLRRPHSETRSATAWGLAPA